MHIGEYSCKETPRRAGAGRIAQWIAIFVFAAAGCTNDGREIGEGPSTTNPPSTSTPPESSNPPETGNPPDTSNPPQTSTPPGTGKPANPPVEPGVSIAALQRLSSCEEAET